MPRETVAASRGQFEVQVAWRRGMYASLGVVHTGNIVKVIDTRDGDEFDSLWSELNVDDIDRLIKVLRRVKRQLALQPNIKKDDAYAPLPDA